MNGRGWASGQLGTAGWVPEHTPCGVGSVSLQVFFVSPRDGPPLWHSGHDFMG